MTWVFQTKYTEYLKNVISPTILLKLKFSLELKQFYYLGKLFVNASGHEHVLIPFQVEGLGEKRGFE